MASGGRLDVLIAIREREELAARVELAQAEGLLTKARDRVLELRRQAAESAPLDASAGAWELLDRARASAQARVAQAEQEQRRAEEQVRKAQEAEARAHRRADMVRRVVQRRREEARAAEEKREARALDDLAASRRGRTGD
ncbi:MAG TPA: flagellar FliJ family protein [Myxococcaceae bacterium]|nr:flagellar FliJ family protein [Myxococcaceae bacterium]